MNLYFNLIILHLYFNFTIYWFGQYITRIFTLKILFKNKIIRGSKIILLNPPFYNLINYENKIFIKILIIKIVGYI